MRRDRLSKLADYLETLPEESFNMSTWWCGTAGCAMGHACDLFAEDGLYLDVNSDFDRVPIHQGNEGYGAAQSFFELSINDSFRLFAPTWYFDSSKQSVVKRIRELISTR